jgi:cytochrome bd ubiquinol oxidase subunit II
MEILWFCIVAFMLVMYTVLDGFDLGAGILHLVVAKSDEERRTVLGAIGPVWDGNEVWLLAASGVLYLAFPWLYASSFSGFYLPLTMILWLFMLRGLGIELRHHVDHPLWRAFWDSLFALGSALLSIFLGVALGNVVRGVPLNSTGYFFVPLWTSFTVQPEAGLLDWFTVLMGLVGLSALTVHGGNYLAMKTTGEVQIRSRGASKAMVWPLLALNVATLAAAQSIRPAMWNNFAAVPWGWLIPALAVVAMVGMVVFPRQNKDGWSFAASSAYIGAMLASTAFSLFPNVLPASTNAEYALTVTNTSAAAYGLGVGVVWWVAGTLLAMGYFTYLFFVFRGKVKVVPEGY